MSDVVRNHNVVFLMSRLINVLKISTIDANVWHMYALMRFTVVSMFLKFGISLDISKLESIREKVAVP